MKKALLLGVFSVIIGFAGCYYDKYENLDPNFKACDTTGTVTYTKHLKPIFSANCTICHSVSGGKAGGYDFNDYNSAVNAAPRLVGAVKHLPGHQPMPNGGTKIDPCSIAKIEKWVNTGKAL